MLSVLWICTPSLLARAWSSAVFPSKEREDEVSVPGDGRHKFQS